jgi:transcriptional regulator with XRE-family HTH domain
MIAVTDDKTKAEAEKRSRAAKKALARNTKRLLRELGWSRYRLSQETGLNQMTIGNICNGVHEPSASKLKTIAVALGVTADDLLGESPKKVSRSA